MKKFASLRITKRIILSLTAIVILSFSLYAASALEKENADTNLPKVSVIIPVYNTELYLEECLDSVINQTLKELQIICINDGSEDSSLEILKKYEKLDNRIMIIDQENQGACIARNKGLDMAKGEYIAFIDSDDYLDLNTYELAYNESKEKNLDILNFGWKSFPKETDWDKYKSSPKQKLFVSNSGEAWFYCGTGANVNIWNKLYKRSFLNSINARFKEDLKCAQDYYFNIIIFPNAQRIEFIPDKLYNYRRNAVNSITSKNKGFSRLQTHIEIIKGVIENWSKSAVLKGNEIKLLRHFLRWNIFEISNIEDLEQKAYCAKEMLLAFKPLNYENIKNEIDKITLSNLNKLESFIQ